MTEVIRDFWAVIAGVVGAAVWLVRLEARGIANASEVKRLWAQRKEDLQAAKDSRERTDKQLDEISADIKAILRGMNK